MSETGLTLLIADVVAARIEALRGRPTARELHEAALVIEAVLQRVSHEDRLLVLQLVAVRLLASDP